LGIIQPKKCEFRVFFGRDDKKGKKQTLLVGEKEFDMAPCATGNQEAVEVSLDKAIKNTKFTNVKLGVTFKIVDTDKQADPDQLATRNQSLAMN